MTLKKLGRNPSKFRKDFLRILYELKITEMKLGSLFFKSDYESIGMELKEIC